ncbi:19963_t:CDS:2 [Dentiscutata erythropus]|uniref:19963_t:CDS:1 n=1 Tax=Dentiscutata erythropus TaxID=1348616 RepID=A0A9N9GXT3_9GLOM|nr:19963_t:CDS:2 [Dentiscutata erythropus]
MEDNHDRKIQSVPNKFIVNNKKNITLSAFASPQDVASQIIPSITQGIVPITSNIVLATPSSNQITQPTTDTSPNNVITITSISTVLPSIGATPNPNFPGTNGGSGNSINDSSNDSGGPSGLVVGILVVGGLVLLGAATSGCYCYRRYRLSIRYDDEYDGGEVVLRGNQDPFQSTLDQYHRTRF